ncbi:MAG: NADH dehydrogenase (quinone) subunit G [Anaerolineae bacterium]|nr:MAG: NADH dehydrogenase (quinone) subunit G [Anaerolineae bacterium]
MVTVTIDGQQVKVPAGTLVVDAAKMVGIDIPVFCYHPKMEPVGMCRMCLVEVGRPMRDRATGEPVLNADGSPKIQFGPRLETSCTTPVSDGMVVRFASEKATAARKDIIEFLLTSHPLDCPICDKGGECPLQNLTMAHGVGESRFLFDEKMHLEKNVPLGDLIFLDRERCIQCARCIRFQRDIAGDPVIHFHERGRATEIVTVSDPGFDSYWSGNTTDICPVGALTTADFRFGARPWELKATASICSQCAVGCNLTFNVRREAKSGGRIAIKRVMPRQNEEVNEIWICDKGRFAAYHYTESKERLTQPLVRKNGELLPASWEEALDLVASRFETSLDAFVTLVGGRLSNEDLFNLRLLNEKLGGERLLDTHMAGGDLMAEFGVAAGTNFSDFGPGDAILVVASDLEEEAPLWYLRVKQAAERGATLIVANPRPTKIARYAHHELRYAYGQEAATVLAMVNAIGSQKTRLPAWIADFSGDEALQAAAQAFAQAENAVVIYGQEGLGLEGSRDLAQACAGLLFITDHLGRPKNGLLAAWQRVNDQGAWDMGFRPAGDLKTTLSQAQAAYIVAADPVGDQPALAEALEHAGFVVVQDLFLTETAKMADVVLPAQAYVERDGTYTSAERRVQRFYPAVPALAETRPDFAITAQIAGRMNIKMEERIAGLVFSQIAREVVDYEGLSYRQLAEVRPQWPEVARSELYYGGTSYENSQGLGVQLKPASQVRKLFRIEWRQPQAALPAGELVAVPVTRLYDLGTTVAPSQVLAPRLTSPHVALNPQDAARLGVQDGALVAFSVHGVTREVRVHLWDAVPAGVVLAPRSVGLPVVAPAPAGVRVAEGQSA